MPVVGLLLIGMTGLAAVGAGHLVVDLVGALDQEAQRAKQTVEGDLPAATEAPAWRARLLDPWEQCPAPPAP